MPWSEWWQTSIDEIDETEKRVDNTWLKVLAAIAAWELWLRRRTIRRALDMPVVDAGWVDTARRRALRTFRSAVMRDAATLKRGLTLDIGGTKDPFGVSPERFRPPTGGISPPAVDATVAGIRKAWERLDRILERAERELRREPPSGPGSPPPGGRPPSGPGSLAPDEALVAMERGTSAREIEDRFEVGMDMLLNIARNVSYEADRVVETAVRLTGRFSKPASIIDWMNGSGPNAQPWQINRNNLKLSSTAHIRAAHRRRTISEATARGISRFRLDVPRSRLNEVGGILADHIWKVRTLDEWQEVAAKLNRRRIAASGFDTLGLFHNDFSYVVPVPAVFLDAATKQADRLRSRRLAA